MKNVKTTLRSLSKVTIIAILLISIQFSFTHHSTSVSQNIDHYFLVELQKLKTEINKLKKAAQLKYPQNKIQNDFLNCRLVFKKIAVLTDYFNQLETRYLNSPAINRIESEVSDLIIEPTGFQAIEQILFSKMENNFYPTLTTLADGMLNIISKMENEPGREFKFKEELVWDALRSSIVQITTTGITGFDSPVAFYSLPEAIASLDGIEALLNFYKPLIEIKTKEDFEELITHIHQSKSILKNTGAFEKLNRLNFITEYLDPLYKKFVTLRIKSGISVPDGKSAINYYSTSIFDQDALNINFYSPPEDYWITDDRIKLGRILFSDPILSGTKSRSCASCHQPGKAFTDGITKPYALDGKILLSRNTPTLWNSGFQTKQFYDSRADILENQLGEVVHNTEEMKGSLKISVQELSKNSFYVEMFKKAYLKEKDPINTFTIANAISSYVRSLRSLNSRFDKYMRGDKKQLTEAEKKGFNLFTGKAKCATCHFIPLFNGVVPPFFADTESEVLGVPASNNKRNARLDNDEGKFNFTQSIIHKFSFKTPTLRNVELTAPYMHNGVFNTLEEVMKFYNNGGGKGLNIDPPNQTLPFEKLHLSKLEINNIILFMKTLTDTTYSF